MVSIKICTSKMSHAVIKKSECNLENKLFEMAHWIIRDLKKNIDY